MSQSSFFASPPDPNDPDGLQQGPAYARIYLVVREIPAGRVATYGQIAAIIGKCSARMVGYAMAAVPPGSDVPWQRVINAQGKISPRGDGSGVMEQRNRLEAEGIVFSPEGKVELRQVRWLGPSFEWLIANGFDPAPLWRAE